MNRDIIIHAMSASFKQANIDLAIKNGMEEKQANLVVEQMSDSIKTCMENVSDTLLENFPEFIK